MNWKWNCKGDNIQIFPSEIILACKNGSQGHNFGKILNSQFLKGLRHSALLMVHSAHPALQDISMNYTPLHCTSSAEVRLTNRRYRRYLRRLRLDWPTLLMACAHNFEVLWLIETRLSVFLSTIELCSVFLWIIWHCIVLHSSNSTVDHYCC